MTAGATADNRGRLEASGVDDQVTSVPSERIREIEVDRSTSATDEIGHNGRGIANHAPGWKKFGKKSSKINENRQ